MYELNPQETDTENQNRLLFTIKIIIAKRSEKDISRKIILSSKASFSSNQLTRRQLGQHRNRINMRFARLGPGNLGCLSPQHRPIRRSDHYRAQAGCPPRLGAHRLHLLLRFSLFSASRFKHP